MCRIARSPSLCCGFAGPCCISTPSSPIQLPIIMTDADVFGKLSRIFETHAYGEEDDLDDLLEDFEPASSNNFNDSTFSPGSPRKASSMSPRKL